MREGSRIRSIMRKTVVTLGLAFVFLVVVGRDVRAQVNHLDIGALPQHADEVLSDVVEVTLH